MLNDEGELRKTIEWDNRFHLTTSKSNHKLHPYYREYFDKKPKQIPQSFHFKYASSTNELPGIVDNESKQNRVKNLLYPPFIYIF